MISLMMIVDNEHDEKINKYIRDGNFRIGLWKNLYPGWKWWASALQNNSSKKVNPEKISDYFHGNF